MPSPHASEDQIGGVVRRPVSITDVRAGGRTSGWDCEAPAEKPTDGSPGDKLIKAVESVLQAGMREWHGKFQKEVQVESDRLFSRLAEVERTAGPAPSLPFSEASLAPSLPFAESLSYQRHQRRGSRKRGRAPSLTSSLPLDPGVEWIAAPYNAHAAEKDQAGRLMTNKSSEFAVIAESSVENLAPSGVEQGLPQASLGNGTPIASVPLSDASFATRSFPQKVAFAVDSDDVGNLHGRCSVARWSIVNWTSMSGVESASLRTVWESKYFEYAVSTAIFLNCATMGLQAHSAVSCIEGVELMKGCDGTITFLSWSEHVFTSIFTLENFIRLKLHGCRAYMPTTGDGATNLADAILVLFTGVFANWVLPVLEEVAGLKMNDREIKIMTVFRAFRLVRLLRVLRKVPWFREAWMLLRGLKDSLRTLFWTILVIFVVTYAWAVLGLVTIVQDLQAMDNPELEPMLVEYFLGIDNLMFTLTQVLTQDSFHALIRQVQPYCPIAWLYFYSYSAVACLVLMNLVTAIIVENALSNSNQDHEAAVQEMERKNNDNLKGLQILFDLMDEDGNGTLSWEEFQKSFEDEEIKAKWMLLDFHPRDCKELFSMLDDGDGEIETDEFFEGLGKMKGVAQSKDVYRLLKSICKLQNTMVRISTAQNPNLMEQWGSLMSNKASQLESGAKWVAPKDTRSSRGKEAPVRH